MSTVIAVAGKGGTGKTTFCGMFIDWMIGKKMTPILAVDADANSNLNEVLGVEPEKTLGEIREMVASAEMAEKNPIPTGMSKKDFMDFQFANAIAEEDDFDLLVMGRTQGKGCYCFVNGLLQAEIQKIQNNYKYIVVDNEAGMEHISRGTLPSVDYMVLVSDCSRRGIQAVARIAELVGELKLNPKKMVLIVNRAPNGVVNEGVKEEIAKHGLQLIGVIPQDETVYEYDGEGRPTSKLPADNPARRAVNEIAEKLFK